MTSTAAPALPDAQRHILAQALADAISYQDPPLECADCDTLAALCPQCTARLTQARAYLALRRQLGMGPPPSGAGSAASSRA